MLFKILISKFILFFLRFFNLGSGSTWPGHIALKLDKNIIKKILTKNKKLKIIIVAGTNGKTTTTLLLKHILKKLGYKVFSNQEGANLLNGIASTLVKYSTVVGKLDYDFAVFEVDEFSFPLVVNEFIPKAVILLNLFRDQLDRYGEVNTIGLRWFRTLKTLPKDLLLIVNGDDPYLYFSSKNLKLKKYYFGISGKLMNLKNIPHDVDFIYCPNCQNLLDYKSISYSHLGDYFCRKCGFKKGETENFEKEKINYPVKGLYNIYNVHAALTLIKYLIKIKLDYRLIFSGFKPAFGRQEEIVYKNKKIFILLSKNPAGFNQSITLVADILKNKKANFLLVLNNRIPDGRDVSWIWDVNFFPLIKKADKIFVSGDRAYDMVLRLKYENMNLKKSAFVVVSDLKNAVNKALLKTNKNQKLYILATYSAMLEIRKILSGNKFL